MINISCCVLNVFTQEIIGDDVRLALAAPEVAPDLAQQLRLIIGALTTQGIAFDILVEQLIRVKLRTIAGKENEPNPRLIFLHPVFHLERAVHRVTVDNEIYAAIILPEQAPKKFQENLGSKALFEHHKV